MGGEGVKTSSPAPNIKFMCNPTLRTKAFLTQRFNSFAHALKK